MHNRLHTFGHPKESWNNNSNFGPTSLHWRHDQTRYNIKNVERKISLFSNLSQHHLTLVTNWNILTNSVFWNTLCAKLLQYAELKCCCVSCGWALYTCWNWSTLLGLVLGQLLMGKPFLKKYSFRELSLLRYSFLGTVLIAKCRDLRKDLLTITRTESVWSFRLTFTADN